jgi:hypothetical protein
MIVEKANQTEVEQQERLVCIYQHNYNRVEQTAKRLADLTQLECAAR